MFGDVGYLPRLDFLPDHDPETILETFGPKMRVVIQEAFLALLAPLGASWIADPSWCEAMEAIDIALAVTELTLMFPALEVRHVTCFVRLVFETGLLNPNTLDPVLQSKVADDLAVHGFYVDSGANIDPGSGETWASGPAANAAALCSNLHSMVADDLGVDGFDTGCGVYQNSESRET
jgi:hypothetical protein